MPDFLDEKFLEKLTEHLAEKVGQHQSATDRLIMLSGARMNWIADFVTDPGVEWSKEDLNIDDIYLTGTNPEWNKVIIDMCERSPKKLRELIQSSSDIATVFSDAKFEDIPVLIRVEEEKFKILDGMHRTVAAIRDGREIITAFVGRLKGDKLMPMVEPHVVYDLIKAYQRSKEKDRIALIAALRLLKNNCANVDDLLRKRFNKSWIPSDDIQEIVQEALKS